MSKYKLNDSQFAIVEKLELNSNIDDVEKLFSSNEIVFLPLIPL